MVATRTTAASTAPRRESLGRMVSSSTVLLMSIIGALILALAFLILFHENANATNGYRLRTLERDRSVLLLELEVLNMQVAQAQSLQSLNQDPQINAMLQVKKPQYTTDVSSSSSSSSVSSASSSTASVSSAAVSSSSISSAPAPY